MVFADPARRAFCQEWERAAHSCVAELRAAYGQDPASPRSSRNSPATPGRSPVCGAYTRPRASRGRASACATRRWATCTSGSPPSRSTAPRTSNSSSTRRSRPVRRPRRSRGCGPPGASSPPVVTRRQVRLHTRGLSSRHADPGWGTRAVLSKAAPQKEPLCSGSITSTTCLGRSPGARAGPVGTATAVEPLARPTSPTYFSPPLAPGTPWARRARAAAFSDWGPRLRVWGATDQHHRLLVVEESQAVVSRGAGDGEVRRWHVMRARHRAAPAAVCAVSRIALPPKLPRSQRKRPCGIHARNGH